MPIIPIIRSGKIKKVESDFSTCTITFAGTEGDSNTGNCAVIDNDGIVIGGLYDCDVGDTITAVLYKGTGILMAPNIASVSGNATLSNGIVIYTGDCTITLSHIDS